MLTKMEIEKYATPMKVQNYLFLVIDVINQTGYNTAVPLLVSLFILNLKKNFEKNLIDENFMHFFNINSALNKHMGPSGSFITYIL